MADLGAETSILDLNPDTTAEDLRAQATEAIGIGDMESAIVSLDQARAIEAQGMEQPVEHDPVLDQAMLSQDPTAEVDFETGELIPAPEIAQETEPAFDPAVAQEHMFEQYAVPTQEQLPPEPILGEPEVIQDQPVDTVPSMDPYAGDTAPLPPTLDEQASTKETEANDRLLAGDFEGYTASMMTANDLRSQAKAEAIQADFDAKERERAAVVTAAVTAVDNSTTELKSHNIDPSLGLGQTILGIVGAVVYQLGSGLRGTDGPNVVLAAMDSAIKNNITKQKMKLGVLRDDLEAKQSALGVAVDNLQSLEAAEIKALSLAQREAASRLRALQSSTRIGLSAKRLKMLSDKYDKDADRGDKRVNIAEARHRANVDFKHYQVEMGLNQQEHRRTSQAITLENQRLRKLGLTATIGEKNYGEYGSVGQQTVAKRQLANYEFTHKSASNAFALLKKNAGNIGAMDYMKNNKFLSKWKEDDVRLLSQQLEWMKAFPRKEFFGATLTDGEKEAYQKMSFGDPATWSGETVRAAMKVSIGYTERIRGMTEATVANNLTERPKNLNIVRDLGLKPVEEGISYSDLISGARQPEAVGVEAPAERPQIEAPAETRTGAAQKFLGKEYEPEPIQSGQPAGEPVEDVSPTAAPANEVPAFGENSPMLDDFVGSLRGENTIQWGEGRTWMDSLKQSYKMPKRSRHVEEFISKYPWQSNDHKQTFLDWLNE